MKKFLIVILALFLLCGTLTACGNEGTDNETEAGDSQNQTTENSTSTTSDSGMIKIETYEANDNAADVFDGLFENNSSFSFDIKTFEPVKPNEIEFTIDEFKLNMGENIDAADKSKIDSMDEKKRNEIATKKANLVYDLAIAFKSQGINVAINETTGEMSLDSTVLFGGDSAVLSQDGKNFLKKFIAAYSSVVFGTEYDGFVSKIMVEGHAAPVSGSTYESGLPLSKERADNVKKYCVSKEPALSDELLANLNRTLEAVGLSNSKPVKDSTGKVNMAGSRRVTFRFLINID